MKRRGGLRPGREKRVVAYETSIEIEADAARVWELLSRVDDWPRWLPTVIHVEPLDGAGLDIGKRYRVTQPKLRPAMWTVTGIDPGRRFEWRARSPGVTMVADHALEPLSEHVLRVRLSFRFEGILGALLGTLFGRITRSYMQEEARALKRHAEAG